MAWPLALLLLLWTPAFAAEVSTGSPTRVSLEAVPQKAPLHRQRPGPRALPSAEAYVRWLYAQYRDGGHFNSELAYSPSLHALFAWNRRLLQGEVGDNNDADMICQCQDWDHLRLLSLTLAPVRPGVEDARVMFENAGRRTALRLRLVPTLHGWRVHDVLDRPGGLGSLRARLIDENRRLAAGKRP